MKKYIVLAALLLVTGCANNPNATNNQQADFTQKSTTPMITAVPNVTQASSITAPLPGKSSNTMKGTQFTFPDWIFGGQVQVNPPRVQYPAVRQPSAQVPADQTPTTKNPTDQPSASNQFDQQVLQIVNSERSKAGLGSLSMDNNLSKMAMVKAQDMYDNNYFSHTSPTYGSPFDMMRDFNITYNAAGENIAKGQQTPTRVMNDWMNSPGHRANILSRSFTKIGIAYFKGAWVQEFIG